MVYRKTVLANEQIYHILNRGVEERNIFLDKRDYSRFFQSFLYYQKANPPVRFSFKQFTQEKLLSKLENLVEIICYCLMPNHFHFLLKQKKSHGISSFIKKLTNSYARYFNIRHQRRGHLFQGPFKAIRMENDEQLIHVSRYIHLNPVTSFLVENPQDYPFCSYSEYLSLKNEKVCQKDIILDQFHSLDDYEKFVLDQKDYARKLKMIEKFITE